MSLIGNYLDENVDQEADALAKSLPNRLAQRRQQLAAAAQALSDENALVEGVAAKLDPADRPAERVAYRGFARKQFRRFELDSLSLYVQRLASNLVETEAQQLDWIIEQVATDTGSDFATLMTAIQAAYDARNV